MATAIFESKSFKDHVKGLEAKGKMHGNIIKGINAITGSIGNLSIGLSRSRLR